MRPNKFEDRNDRLKVSMTLIIYLFYLLLYREKHFLSSRVRKWDERLGDIRQLPWGIQEIDNQWWYGENKHQTNLTISSLGLSWDKVIWAPDIHYSVIYGFWIGWYSINNPEGTFIKALTNGLNTGWTSYWYHRQGQYHTVNHIF